MLDIAQNTKSMGTLATLFLFTTLRAGACALVYPTVEVSQNFRVRVLDRDRSVKGLKVTLGSVTDALSTSSPVVNQSMTGSDGYADFVDVAPGAYFVSADHDGGI